jgi:hypothetical protein
LRAGVCRQGGDQIAFRNQLLEPDMLVGKAAEKNFLQLDELVP